MEEKKNTHPTLTQVPPNRPDSMIMAFVPNLELAIRADARPPLPPPMTRKSVSLDMGAMLRCEVEMCRDMLAMRKVAVLYESLLGARKRPWKACMPVLKNVDGRGRG